MVPLRLSAHAARLFAYLLLNRDRSQTREHVAFTLFPDDDEADARANLRRKLHLLQRALPVRREPWILTTATSVGWDTNAPYRLDVAEFERLSASDTSLEAADALYRGDLLVDFYDDWIVRERDRLRTIAMNNLQTLIVRHQGRRDYPNAIRFAQRLRALDPWREDAVRTLIALRYESGDRAGALTEYERFRAVLETEMGVEPMPETVCVYENALAYAQTSRAGERAAPEPSQATAAGLPFVNRESEIAALRSAWTQASNGNGGTLLAVGEAGIGKSRLIEEFATFARSNGGRVLRGGTTPFELAPYQAFSEALRGALPILRETPIEPLWLSVLASLVPQLHVAFRDLRRLTPLDAEPERARLFEAFEAAMNALSAARPVLLVLEDLHWAGSATIALFEHLARHAPGLRLLIVASYREEELPRTHLLRVTRRRLERERLLRALALGPLGISAVEDLVGNFIDDKPEHRSTIARYLLDSSDGNPFFLGELVANDREAGVFDAAARRWRERSTPPGLPSLTATLNARLERLSGRARSIAEVAAVVGRAFSAELVREVSGADERSTLDGIGELLDRRLVREVDAAGTDFAFSHQLIAQTVYAGLTSEVRQHRHRRIGTVIEELYSEQIEAFAAEIASHFDRGGEPEPAAEYYVLAARQALTLYGSEEAKSLGLRTLELTQDAILRFRATEVIEEAARRLGDRDAQRTNVTQLLEIARDVGDVEFVCEALRREIILAHDTGERDRENRAITALETRLSDARPIWTATHARLKGSYLTAIGAYREARAVMADALAGVSRIDHPSIYVECRCALVQLAGFEGRIADVREFLDDVPSFERDYDLTQVLTLLETACAVAIRIQDHSALSVCAERLLACSKNVGYLSGEATAYHFSGRAALALFDIERAQNDLQRAMQMFTSIGDPLKSFMVRSSIANLMTTIGRFAQAIEQFEAADAVAMSISYGFGHFACLNNISYAACMNGDFTLAKSSALRALEAAELLGAPSARAHALVSLGIAESQLGDTDHAIVHLQDGTALERELHENIALAEDLCQLVMALLRGGFVERATVQLEELLVLAANSSEKLSHPQLVHWTAALVYRAQGNLRSATESLKRARQLLDDLESTIPDAEFRKTFRTLRYNRAIDIAFDTNHWNL